MKSFEQSSFFDEGEYAPKLDESLDTSDVREPELSLGGPLFADDAEDVHADSEGDGPLAAQDPAADHDEAPTDSAQEPESPAETPAAFSEPAAHDLAAAAAASRAHSDVDARIAESSFFADPDASVSTGAPFFVQPTPEPTPAEEPEAPASTAGIHDPGQEAVDAFFGPVKLDRPRPQRAPLIPRWVWIAIATAVGVVVLVGLGFWISSSFANIPVPRLTGVDVDTARARLAQDGLKLAITERRFSPSISGIVLAQTPSADTKVKRGDTVNVVVSAGTEQFSMPNVVGDGLLLARGQLESRGLEVRVESQPSQQASDTVLASNPPAGTAMHTGDIVRLTVAAPGPSAALLLPYDLSGVRVVIDPAPVNDAQTDVPLDVARRLRSLIEASHGTVIATRALSQASTLDSVASRAGRAAASTSTVAIGLSTVPAGTGGIVVFAPSPVLAHATASAKLASRIASNLAGEAGGVSSATSTTDTVLSAADSPWSRVQLGSFGQREDVAKFGDSSWEDAVARGLYRAIATLYGKKVATP